MPDGPGDDPVDQRVAYIRYALISQNWIIDSLVVDVGGARLAAHLERPRTRFLTRSGLREIEE